MDTCLFTWEKQKTPAVWVVKADTTQLHPIIFEFTIDKYTDLKQKKTAWLPDALQLQEQTTRTPGVSLSLYIYIYNIYIYIFVYVSFYSTVHCVYIPKDPGMS